MNKLIYFLSVMIITLIAACNNSGEQQNHAVDELKSKVDSLYNAVIDEHNEAMAAQMTKLRKAKENTQHLIDSVTKLPAKAKGAASSYKEKLDLLMKDLNEAGTAMDTWMEEFISDSLKNNTEERIKYLTNEKLKVSKVKEAIFNSLDKADSLLKQKF
jgi:outer membrane murein-binding lipoprotein Lpp